MTNSSTQKRGRPTLLSRKVIKEVAAAVEAGKTREETAAHVGVSLSTMQSWITQGRRVQKAVLVRGQGVAPVVARQKGETLDELTLELVFAIDIVNGKTRAVRSILSPAELERDVPKDGKPNGRPAVLTAAMVDAIAGLCAADDLDAAAAAAGVDRRSVRRWLTRGRDVHLAGGAISEHERLCGTLYARVEGATASEPAPAEPPTRPARAVARPALIVLTVDRVAQLVGAVWEGANRPAAARRAGVSYSTFARWLALGARVNETGAYASEHERLCGVLRSEVAAADRARAAGPDAAPGIVAVGGVVDTVALARRLQEQPGCLVPGSGAVVLPAGSGVRPQRRWTLLGRRIANRFRFRTVVRA
ncbi:hypothetical protein [Streptomyces virginiae]|uniref:hypothetical protein n=1 Tax=Streptomyces virginiae TaxID=1961 RepID=UPI0036522E25